MKRLIQTDKLLNLPRDGGRKAGGRAVVFNDVLDVEMRADTTPPFNTWGTSVKQVGPVTTGFYAVLEAFISDLEQLAGCKPTAIVLCSVWRAAKAGEKHNRHAEGRAWDIGSVWWPRAKNLPPRITAISFPTLDAEGLRHYLAFEAVLRRRFGTVLSWLYDEAHHHHWHADNGREVGLVRRDFDQHRRVQVLFAQAALRYVMNDESVTIDGKWGPKTRAALERQVEGDLLEVEVWRAFLGKVARAGFSSHGA